MRTLAALAAALTLALVSCAPTVAEPSPSPSPSASPSPSPVAVATPSATPTASPSPTPARTSAPPATERPISRIAGDRLLPYYFEIRQLFPLLPPSLEIMPDEPSGTEGNAFFHGLNARGEPRFAVREDFVMDRGTAAHEVGHAYMKVLERAGPPSRDVLALYWTFRGFPGTWKQAMTQSQSQASGSAQWIWNPVESWAEAFRAAVMLEVKEKTLDYGKTIDPAATREFFRSLASSSG